MDLLTTYLNHIIVFGSVIFFIYCRNHEVEINIPEECLEKDRITNLLAQYHFDLTTLPLKSSCEDCWTFEKVESWALSFDDRIQERGRENVVNFWKNLMAVTETETLIQNGVSDLVKQEKYNEALIFFVICMYILEHFEPVLAEKKARMETIKELEGILEKLEVLFFKKT